MILAAFLLAVVALILLWMNVNDRVALYPCLLCLILAVLLLSFPFARSLPLR